MEFKKILLLGTLLLSTKTTLWSAEGSRAFALGQEAWPEKVESRQGDAEEAQAGPADEGDAAAAVQKMVTLKTNDHTVDNPQLFEMPLYQAKAMGIVKNLLEDFGKEGYVYGHGESNDGKESISLPNIDSGIFKIIKQWIESCEDGLPYSEETKAQVKDSLQRFIGELKGQALFDTLLNIGQAVDILELHLFNDEVEDVSINGVFKKIINEWTGEVVADLLVEFLNDNRDAFLNGELQFPNETMDAGGFLEKLTKERMMALVAKYYREAQVLQGHRAGVNALLLGEEGALYSGSDDYTIRVWQRVDGQYGEPQVLGRQTSWVNTLVLGEEGTLYSGLDDGTIWVWQRVNGQYVATQVLREHMGWVNALLLGEEGTLYSGSFDWTIRIWQRGEDGQYGEPQVLEGHTNWVRALVLGSDGILYSGSDDRTIRVWQRVDGQYGEPQVLEGHTNWVRALVLGSDGILYSGSDDCTIRVWQRVDGQYREPQVLGRHRGLVKILVLGSDGTLYSGSSDWTIRVWKSLILIQNYKNDLDWKQVAVLMFVAKAKKVPQQEEGAPAGYSTAREIYDAIPEAIKNELGRF